MTTDIVSTLIEQTKLSPLQTSRQIDEGSPVMSTPQYGDYQFDIYFDGLEGQLPKYPVDFAIYCSNHGGRQANGGLPALDALPAVVEAADGMRVLFDSGVRSGSDVAKALALGATAVGIGRPYAYALAVGGTDGVVAQLRAILAELDLLMAIDGFPTLADLRAAGAQRI
jgi:hypothetical protein